MQDEGASTTLILIGAAHHRRCLLERTVELWRRRVDDSQALKRRREAVAAGLHTNKLRYVFFRAWQWQLAQRHSARTLLQIAIVHRLRAQLRAWRAVVVRARKQRAVVHRWINVERRPAVAHLLRRFAPWVRVASRAVAVRGLREQASRQLLHTALLDKWRRWACAHRFSRQLAALQAVVLSSKLGPEPFAAICFHRWLVSAAARRCRTLRRNEAALRAIRGRRLLSTLRSSFRALLLHCRLRILVRRVGLGILRQRFAQLRSFRDARVASRIQGHIAAKYFLGSLLLRWRRRACTSAKRRADDAAADAMSARSLLSSALRRWTLRKAHREFVREGVSRALTTVRTQMLMRGAVAAMLTSTIGRVATLNAVRPSAESHLQAPNDDEEFAKPPGRQLFSCSNARHGGAAAVCEPAVVDDGSSDQRRGAAARRRQAPLPLRPFVDPISGVVVGRAAHVDPSVASVDAADTTTMPTSSPLQPLTEQHVTALIDELEALKASKSSDAAALIALRRQAEELDARMHIGDGNTRVVTERQRAVVHAELEKVRDRVQHRLALRSRIRMVMAQLHSAVNAPMFRSSPPPHMHATTPRTEPRPAAAAAALFIDEHSEARPKSVSFALQPEVAFGAVVAAH